MLSLRSLRTPCAPLVRWGSTAVQDAGNSSSAPALPVYKGPRQRTKYSLDRLKEWNPAVRPGVIPAYDEALKYIKQDSDNLKAELKELKKEREEALKKLKTAKPEQKRALEERIQYLDTKMPIIEVQSEINLPEVRWKVANAMGDLKIPSHRYLKEQRWRKEGALDLLMERIYQMNVIPDVIPEIKPSLDLRLTFPAPPRTYLSKAPPQVAVRPEAIEPGTYVLPQQSRSAPKLYTSTFHTDERLYTMLMVDPDVPDERTAGFSTYLHWMQPNIRLSALLPTRITDLVKSNQCAPYVPPHPQEGSKYHRYVIMLLPQENDTDILNIPSPRTNQDRKDFDVRAFMKEYKLDQREGGGIHMFREVWNKEVSRIYADVLEEAEPRYGRPRLSDNYQYTAEERGPRYV